MSDREPDQDQPSLELPSLGGWRRKRRAQRREPASAPAGGEQATDLRPETVADAPPPAPTGGGSSTTVPTQKVDTPPPPASAPAGGEQATDLRSETVADAPPPAPTGGGQSTALPTQKVDTPPPPEPTPAGGEQTTDRVPKTVADAPPAAPEPEPEPEPVSGGRSTTVLTETVEEAPPPGRRAVRLPRPAGYVAVLGTGALVGLLLVALTWGSLQTCERVQGTSSCGTAGYPMLLFVLVLAVVGGAMLLRLLQVADPVGTSFLGTGLTTVLALVFLVDQLDEPAMVVVVPLLTAACFAAARWVTATFIEPGERDS